jgi:hypothetical protein
MSAGGNHVNKDSPLRAGVTMAAYMPNSLLGINAGLFTPHVYLFFYQFFLEINLRCLHPVVCVGSR